MLEAKAITRRFGRTLALDAVDFAARPGEIHVLLGENGAGKTTLMNVFAGRIRPDGGATTLDGLPLAPGSPPAALDAGIAAVHQSPMLFERMTWEENLALGGFGRKSAMLELEGVAARARALANRLGFELPPRGALIEQRSVAERVRLEVLRALSFDPRVLILDEPTGVLSPTELSAFLDLLRRLRGEGRVIILVTHKLAEALAVADRITVLRDGRVVAETAPAQTSEPELARMMIGELPAASQSVEFTSHAAQPATILEIENLGYRSHGVRVLDGISVSLNAGDIAGVAGVDGNGQVELVEILAGARHPFTGSFRVAAGAGPQPQSSAMAVIPQNRDLDGLILGMTLWENLLLAAPIRARMSRRSFLDVSAARELCRRVLESFQIRAAGPEATAASLSGGNRQRLEVARALAQNPRVLVAHNVCRGLDLAAAADVHRALLNFAAAGGAVMLVSSDLDELLAVSSRLLVMSGGRIRETAPNERSAQTLGLLIAGRWDRA